MPFAEGAASLDWTVYFRVADVDASLATVERLGGTVRRAPEDTPFGRLAEIADPMGATCKFTGPVA